MFWKRLVLFRWFDESQDAAIGPAWAFVLFTVAAVTSVLAMGMAIYCSSTGRNPIPAVGLAVSAFAVLSGAAYHMGMRGRAKNGLALAVLCLVLLAALVSS